MSKSVSVKSGAVVVFRDGISEGRKEIGVVLRRNIRGGVGVIAATIGGDTSDSLPQ